jgi:hypothetical protein
MVPEPSLPRVITELTPIQEFNKRIRTAGRGKKRFTGFMDIPYIWRIMAQG